MIPYGPPSPGPVSYLIEYLENDQQPSVTIEEAQVLRWAMAAYESAREIRPAQLSG